MYKQRKTYRHIPLFNRASQQVRSSTYTETSAGRKEKGSKAEIIKTIRKEQGREEIKKRFKNRAEDIKREG
jgi:hypothetical protein